MASLKLHHYCEKGSAADMMAYRLVLVETLDITK